MQTTNRQTALTYRIGTSADREELMQLGLSAYRQYRHLLTPDNWKLMEEGLRNPEKLDELIGRSTVFICAEEGAIVGAAYLVPSGYPDVIFQEDRACIRRLGVHPS